MYEFFGGGTLYAVSVAANDRAQLYTIEPATTPNPTFTAVGVPQTVDIEATAGIGFALHSEVFYAVTLRVNNMNDRAQLYTIDPATTPNPTFTAVGVPQTVDARGASGFGLAPHNGTLYAVSVAGTNQAQLYTVNPVGPTFTAVGVPQTVLASESSGLGLAPHNGTLYAVSVRGDNQAQLYTIDPATTPNPTFTAVGVPQTVDTNPDAGFGLASFGGTLYAVSVAAGDQAQLYSVNPTGPVFTAIGGPQAVDANRLSGFGLASFG